MVNLMMTNLNLIFDVSKSHGRRAILHDLLSHITWITVSEMEYLLHVSKYIYIYIYIYIYTYKWAPFFFLKDQLMNDTANYTGNIFWRRGLGWVKRILGFNLKIHSKKVKGVNFYVMS